MLIKKKEKNYLIDKENRTLVDIVIKNVENDDDLIKLKRLLNFIAESKPLYYNFPVKELEKLKSWSQLKISKNELDPDYIENYISPLIEKLFRKGKSPDIVTELLLKQNNYIPPRGDINKKL